jgi:serine/threonine protein kinase
MAPELFEREASVTIGTEVDVWALGCMLIELFSNKRPWDYISSTNANCVYYEIFRKKPVPIPDIIPVGVRAIIAACCQYAPSQRTTALDVLGELEALKSEVF